MGQQFHALSFSPQAVQAGVHGVSSGKKLLQQYNLPTSPPSTDLAIKTSFEGARLY
jgi:hypothetical protein